MIFHENRLQADNSHVTSYLIFYRKLGNILQNLSSAAVMIGALRVNGYSVLVAQTTKIDKNYPACKRVKCIIYYVYFSGE